MLVLIGTLQLASAALLLSHWNSAGAERARGRSCVSDFQLCVLPATSHCLPGPERCCVSELSFTRIYLLALILQKKKKWTWMKKAFLKWILSLFHSLADPQNEKQWSGICTHVQQSCPVLAVNGGKVTSLSLRFLIGIWWYFTFLCSLVSYWNYGRESNAMLTECSVKCATFARAPRLWLSKVFDDQLASRPLLAGPLSDCSTHSVLQTHLSHFFLLTNKDIPGGTQQNVMSSQFSTIVFLI